VAAHAGWGAGDGDGVVHVTPSGHAHVGLVLPRRRVVVPVDAAGRAVPPAVADQVALVGEALDQLRRVGRPHGMT